MAEEKVKTRFNGAWACFRTPRQRLSELADAHVVDVADGASEIAAEEVHEVKAEARSSRDFSRELGDFFDGLGPAAYAQEAPPPDSESDDETKTPS